jgi:chromosome segregation ATPase
MYQIKINLESLVSKIKRYNETLFKQCEFLDQNELRRQIAEKNKELEGYPRQNKNCVEYYEKYNHKYQELQSKFTQQQKTEDQISELLEALKRKKAESISENFEKLNKKFS